MMSAIQINNKKTLKYFIYAYLLVLQTIILNPQFANAQITNDFVSDGCTSAPNGNWKHCCYEHDLLYWIGGTFEDRLTADNRLQMCMNDVGGPGHIYYDFVRSAGLTFWSSAWEDQNKTNQLSINEIQQINAEKELWKSLGQPPNFNFINLESILFKALNKDQRTEVNLYFKNSPKQNNEYKDFLKQYIEINGYEPLTTNYIH